MCKQKRGKRIARGSKKVGGYGTLDLVLYLKCQAVNLHGRQVGQKGLTQRPSMGLIPSQALCAGQIYQHSHMRELRQPSIASLCTPICVGSSRGRVVRVTVPGHKHNFVIHAGQGTSPRTAPSTWTAPDMDQASGQGAVKQEWSTPCL